MDAVFVVVRDGVPVALTAPALARLIRDGESVDGVWRYDAPTVTMEMMSLAVLRDATGIEVRVYDGNDRHVAAGRAQFTRPEWVYGQEN